MTATIFEARTLKTGSFLQGHQLVEYSTNTTELSAGLHQVLIGVGRVSKLHWLTRLTIPRSSS